MSTSPVNVSSLLQAFGLGGASNIDVNTIVSELMQVDEQPLVALQTQVTGYQTTLSAYGALLSGVSGLQTAVSAMQNTTTGLAATSSDSTYFTAATDASNTAAAGTTPIEIDNLASAQSLYSINFGSENTAVADLSSAGTQQLQITNGTNTAKINIDSGNNTLSGIAKAINSAGAGVAASVEQVSSNIVINDGTNNTTANNTIAFSYNNHSYTATLSAGNYSGADMAAAMASAMNEATSANGDGTPFAVAYGNTSDEFSITNNGSSTAAIDWATSTATPQQFGFAPGESSDTILAGDALTGTAVNGTYELSLVSNTTGTANRITVKADETGDSNFNETGNNTDKFGLSVLAFDPTNGGLYSGTGVPTGGIENMAQSQAGLDAELSVNGVTIYRPSNTVTDAIPGVTLNLLQAETKAGAANLSVDVSLDSSSLATELSGLVSAYNSAMTTINGLYNPVTSQTTSTQEQEGQGYLNGDSELLNLQQQLQAVPTTQYGASSNVQNNYLAAIGITTDKNGVMSFDPSALSSAYTSANAGGITNMINNFATQIGSSLSEYVNVAVPAEQQNVKTQISNTDSQEASLAQQLIYTQQSLTTEYADLENTVATNANISNYLTQETAQADKQTSGL